MIHHLLRPDADDHHRHPLGESEILEVEVIAI